MQSILFFLLMVMAVATGTELVRWWAGRKRKGSKDTGIILIPIKGHTDNIEDQVRRYINNWHEQIILLDMGADQETRMICYKLENDFSQVEVETFQHLPTRFGFTTNIANL